MTSLRHLFSGHRYRLLKSNIRCFSNASAVISPKTSVNKEEFEKSSLLEQIYREFCHYKGGGIDLKKDSKNGIATICINHPEKKNAISGAMMTQLFDIITELEAWSEGKCVLIYGANNFFCSGGDLDTVRQIDNPEGGQKMSLLMHHNYYRLQSLPLITVALVQGMALGGGAELLTACDFRLMTHNSQIGFVHIRVGITSAWGGGSRLTQLIGPSKALEMMVTGRRVKAEEALRIGLVDEVLQSDDSHCITDAKQWMNKYLNFAPQTLRASKGIVNAAKSLPLQMALQRELEYSTSVWGGPSHKKALYNNVKHR